MSNLYILKDKKPVPVEDYREWVKQFNSNERQVTETIIRDVRISTIFLGMDHSFFGGTPILFETMIFGGDYDGKQERYSTWEEAEKGHHRACKLVVS